MSKTVPKRLAQKFAEIMADVDADEITIPVRGNLGVDALERELVGMGFDVSRTRTFTDAERKTVARHIFTIRRRLLQPG